MFEDQAMQLQGLNLAAIQNQQLHRDHLLNAVFERLFEINRRLAKLEAGEQDVNSDGN